MSKYELVCEEAVHIESTIWEAEDDYVDEKNQKSTDLVSGVPRHYAIRDTEKDRIIRVSDFEQGRKLLLELENGETEIDDLLEQYEYIEEFDNWREIVTPPNHIGGGR